MTSCPPSVSTRHRCEDRKFFAVLVSVAVFVVGVAVSIGSAASASAADSCTPLDPFTTPWAASYTASLGGLHVAAAVVDLSSGCQFHFGATDEFPTASTVKAQIMGAVFLALQDHGATVVPEPLSSQIDAMIIESDNAAAQALYDWLGGGAMLQAYGRRLGMVSIDNADFGWGGDATTPEDEVRLLKTLLEGGGALSPLWVARDHDPPPQPERAPTLQRRQTRPVRHGQRLVELGALIGGEDLREAVSQTLERFFAHARHDTRQGRQPGSTTRQPGSQPTAPANSAVGPSPVGGCPGSC